MPYHRATPKEHIPTAQKKSASPKKRRMEWLYILVGIALGIGLAFSLVPNLRGRLITALRSARTHAASVELTLTNSAMTPTSEFIPSATQSSPANQGTNLAATLTPSPTARPTQPTPIVVTPPLVIKTVVNQATAIPPIIETVINQATDIPSIIPSVLPLP